MLLFRPVNLIWFELTQPYSEDESLCLLEIARNPPRSLVYRTQSKIDCVQTFLAISLDILLYPMLAVSIGLTTALHTICVVHSHICNIVTLTQMASSVRFNISLKFACYDFLTMDMVPGADMPLLDQLN